MDYITNLLNQVNAAIAGLAYPSKPEGLYEPVKYVLLMGGKRIRPMLLLLSYRLYKDDNFEPVMNAALGLETYHNYTLLHDDLMDKAEMRRGKPTVHKVWNSNTAILSGDSMLVLACQLIASVGGSCSREVMDVFLRTALEIGEGQQYDMNFETRNDVTEEEYIEMIRLKTSVLLACAIRIGAMLGGATKDEADLLYSFGERIGLAFQLQDDLLDVYGNPNVFGKRIGGDILCNKKTFLLINAYQRANAEQREELEKWCSTTICDEQSKIEAVTAIYNNLNIRCLCETRINSLFAEAKTCLDKVTLPQEKKQQLWDYAESLLNRTH